MRYKTEPCVICGAIVKTPEINDPWCGSCQIKEQARHAKEDRTGDTTTVFGVTVPLTTRPPKYAVSKTHWKEFGYE